jgi:hypothetical protein
LSAPNRVEEEEEEEEDRTRARRDSRRKRRILFRILQARGAIPDEMGPTTLSRNAGFKQPADEIRTPARRRRRRGI